MRNSYWPFWLPLLLVAWLFVLLPGHPLAPFPGLPLHVPSLVALAVIAVLFFGWTPRQPTRLDRYLLGALVVLSLAKLGTQAASLEYGLRADYYTRAPDGTLSAQPEHSLDYRGLDATRLDRSMGFDARTIPVHFWNDLRFNFYAPDHPNRFGLPLRVQWAGYLYVPETGQVVLRLTSQGPARLAIGDVTLQLPGAGQETTSLTLTQGTHTVVAEYVRLENGNVQFEAAWDRGRGFEPLAAPFLLTAETTPGRWTVSRVAQTAGTLIAGLYLATLLALALRQLREWWHRAWDAPAVPEPRCKRRVVEPASIPIPWTARMERPLLGLFLLLGLAWALYASRPFGQAVILFNGGEDWLTYESYARDILLNGPLQLEGAPAGSARPFYYQVAYPYFLAGLHVMLGESPYMPLVLQLVLVPIEAVLVYYIGRRIYGRPAAVAALLLFIALAVLDFQRFATRLLSENLFHLLLPLTVLALLTLLDRPTLRRAIGAGVVLGLLVVTRFTALPYVFVASAAVWYGLAPSIGRGRASKTILLLVAATIPVIALVPLRNVVAAGVPVLMPTSGAINLMIDHQLPASVDLSEVDTGPLAPLYRQAGLTRSSPQAQLLEYVRQAPADYLGRALHFVGYALGLGAYQAHWWAALVDPPHYEFLLIVVLYVVGCLAWRETGRAECWLIHGFVLTHLLALAIVGIVAYPPRTVLPMYVLMPVVAGFGAVIAIRRAMQALHWTFDILAPASSRP